MNKWFSSLEKQLKEQKAVEALKKNLMGGNGKLGFIVKVMGKPIMYDSSAIEDPGYTGTPSEWDDDDTLPTASGDVYSVGKVFDGLKWGMHLEIQALGVPRPDKHIEAVELKEFKCFYKGYLVYHEKEGKLEAYASFPEWENLVDKLFENAQNRAKVERGEKLAEKERIVQTQKVSLLKQLRMRWGI